MKRYFVMASILMMFGGAVFARHHYIKREVMIRMRDGVSLYTAIYIPRGAVAGSCPIVMLRTPYGCKPYGEQLTDLFERDYWKEYAFRGYIIVFQDVRGRYHSEGTFVHLNPQEAHDAYDSADWLVGNVSECNGRIGVVGNSYGGFYAFMAGTSGHQAIRIVSPQAPVTDWWMGDDMHHYGAFCPTGGGFLDYMQYGESDEELPQDTAVAPSSLYDEYLAYGTISNLSAHLNERRRNDFWNEMVCHPDYDDWWKAKDARRYVQDLSVPAVLITGGSFDGEDYFGTIKLYEAIRNQRPDIDLRRVIGPWTHGGWRRYDKRLGSWRFAWFTSPAKTYMRKVEIPLMEQYLRDINEDYWRDKELFFVTGVNKWTSQPMVKPELQLFLQPDCGLSAFHPNFGVTTYISDPANPVPSNEAGSDGKDYMYADQRFLHGRDDVVSFVTAPLPDDLILRGEAVVHLAVSLTTEDADFFVKIIDVTPCGEQLMIRSEMVRGKYRNINPERLSTTEVNEFDIRLLPFNHAFRRGHRVMVQIQSSAFPLFDRNPQTFTDIYHCDESAFVKSSITLHHSSRNSCYVLLPNVK